jgi:hypothetical protein
LRDKMLWRKHIKSEAWRNLALGKAFYLVRTIEFEVELITAALADNRLIETIGGRNLLRWPPSTGSRVVSR